MSEEQANSLERATDLGTSPQAVARRWKLELKLAETRELNWRKKAKEIYGIYAPESAGANTFNILWTNTETLRQAVYNSTPQPDVRRRYQDEDALGKEVGKVLTRALEFSADTYDEDAVFKGDVLGMLLPGRAVSRVRYVPDISSIGSEDAEQDGEDLQESESYEEIAWEQVILERVHWDDFRILCAGKVWDEVYALAFGHSFTRDDCVEKFGKEVGNKIPLSDADDDDVKASPEKDAFKRARVWEIWDKEGKKVIWICPDYPVPCKTQADPMSLSGFFPVPRPLYAIENDSTLVPTPLYAQYEPQAKELNRISTRINKIIDALKLRGIYDATLTELASLTKANDNEMVPSQGVTALIDRGGLEKAIWMMPIDTAAEVLKVLYEQREATKQVIYEITGIADIMRSATDPNETFGAQKIKTQWGTQRLQRMQQEVQRYIRDLIRLKAEVIAEKFQVETLEKMTLVKLPHQAEVDQQMAQMQAQYQQVAQMAIQQGQQAPPQPQMPPPPITWEAVIEAMHDDATRTFRVDIETDSTLAATQDSDMSAMRDLLGGLAQMITGFGPAVQAGAIPIEAVKQIAMAVVRRAKMGSAVEDALEKMQQPQPGQDPEATKAKAAQAQQQAQQQHEMQLEQMKAQTTIQIERDKAEVQAKVDQNRQMVEAQQKTAEREGDAQLAQFTAQLEAQKEAEQRAHDKELEAMRLQFEDAKSQRDNETKLQIADMQRQASLHAAQLSADTAKETASLSAQTTEKTAAMSADTEKHKAAVASDTTLKAAKESKKPAEPDTAVTDTLAELRQELQHIKKQTEPKPPEPRKPVKLVRGKDGKAEAVDVGGEVLPIKRGKDGRVEGI